MGILLTLLLICPDIGQHPIIYTDTEGNCLAVCDGGHLSHACFFNGRSTTPCYENDGTSTLCDARFISISMDE